MRFIIMHKSSPYWEAGGVPSLELIARVGKLVGELAASKVLLGAEGLRASSEGARLTFSGGRRTIRKGPLEGNNELPSGFTILRVRSLDDAIEWASRQAKAVGDVEVDIRPVTELWDIGLAPRPENLRTRRYMVMRKATGASEAGEAPSPGARADVGRLIDETERAGAHVATVTMRPSSRGRRYKNSREGVRITDGPFTESKELIAGYVIVSAASLDEAGRWAFRYLEAVEADEVDVLEVEV
jgi:hypothetical protein